jgi:metal transporter CNNM
MSEPYVWIGIALCLVQSACFSGLNLAIFSLSRLRLEAAASSGNRDAVRVLALRRDANATLVTILLGNVAINVLLTLLAESVLTGVLSFLFSTLAITLAGEILPQAYFSRHALRMAAILAPMLWVYRILLWPACWPLGKLLDAWVGREGIPWFREAELREILRHHAATEGSEVGRVEAIGAINFLALDDIPICREGEPIDPGSLLRLGFRDGRPVFPAFERSPGDPFLQSLEAPGKKWTVILDESTDPRFVLDAHAFLREALFGGPKFDPAAGCLRPLIVRDPALPLGRVLGKLTVRPERPGDDVIDQDLILLWSPEHRRIVTGSDLLGRLLHGIAQTADPFPGPSSG